MAGGRASVSRRGGRVRSPGTAARRDASTGTIPKGDIPSMSSCPSSAMTDTQVLRVLVVDDEPLAVERLQLLLARSEGVTLVGTAADGEAALRIAEAVRPDLLLLDIAMPGMDRSEEHTSELPSLMRISYS